MNMNAVMMEFGLKVWPANKKWAAQAGDERAAAVMGDSPEQAVQRWLREDVIARMVAVNPPSELLDGEVKQFRETGVVPQRWRMD